MRTCICQLNRHAKVGSRGYLSSVSAQILPTSFLETLVLVMTDQGHTSTGA